MAPEQRSIGSDETGFYVRLVTRARPKESAHPQRSLAEEAASDRSRIRYSSAFRRLQQKTQVYPLAKNAAARSRLTHSIEVSDVGGLIARALVKEFLAPLGADRTDAIVLMVETSCLMHDIGNPPFGHFAETAIQRWFRENRKVFYEESLKGSQGFEERTMDKLSGDFYEFDGNPQSIRIVTRLQGRTTEERLDHGMNLTFSQLLTGLKYLRPPEDSSQVEVTGKPGYFRSESDRIADARRALDVRDDQHFPLSYIVEAADDIAYCQSDIEDGIAAGELDAREFFDAIRQPLNDLKSTDWALPLLEIANGALDNASDSFSGRDAFIVFKTELTPSLIARAANAYIVHHNEIVAGSRPSLFQEGDAEKVLLDALRQISGRYLYSSLRVEQPLRMGYQVIRGLLDGLGQLLKLPASDFDELRKAKSTGNRTRVRETRRDPELLMLDLLPEAYLRTYERERDDSPSSPEAEWFCRAHLILDYMSGMTDDFALRTYQAIAGISYET